MINHYRGIADKPNCYFKKVITDLGPRLLLYTCADIKCVCLFLGWQLDCDSR